MSTTWPGLSREEFASMTAAQRRMRRALWRRTIDRLRADHDARYHAPARRDALRDAS